MPSKRSALLESIGQGATHAGRKADLDMELEDR